MPALGFVIRPEHPPEELPALARRVEAAGFDELWLWEDCFFAGGIAALERLLLEERMAQGGPQFAGVDELTDERVAAMTVSGSPDEAKASIRAFGEAGADAVVLIPPEPGADPAALAQAVA